MDRAESKSPVWTNKATISTADALPAWSDMEGGGQSETDEEDRRRPLGSAHHSAQSNLCDVIWLLGLSLLQSSFTCFYMIC